MYFYSGKLSYGKHTETDRFVYINDFGYCQDYSKMFTYRENGRPDYQLIYVKYGTLTIHDNDEIVKLTGGDICLFRPNEPQIYTIDGENTTHYWILFTGSEIEKILGFFKERSYHIGTFPEFEHFCHSLWSGSQAEYESAELILAVFDNSRVLDDEDKELISSLQNVNATKIAIINKSDLASLLAMSEIESNFDYILNVSAKDEVNIDNLKELVEKLYINEEIDISNDAILINARQNAALTNAEKHLLLALEALRLGLSPDIAGVDIELAMSCLSEIDGREVDEDIVSSIFSHFCVGK